MNRKFWIAGAILLVVILMIACISGARLLLNEWQSRPGRLGQREPLPGLAYCSPKQIRPCILSFHLNAEGGMVIDLLAHGYSPDFYVQIERQDSEYIYECRKARKYSTSVACTGQTLPVGEDLLFRVVSIEGNMTLAAGSFPIIGMALATPDVYFTPTPVNIDRNPR